MTYVVEEKWKRLEIFAVRDTRSPNEEDQAVFYGEDSLGRATEYAGIMNRQVADTDAAAVDKPVEEEGVRVLPAPANDGEAAATAAA